MTKRKVDLVTVLGHTAAGKTAFAAQLACRIGGEIISADSRQVYRGMDIGTGKDYDDYRVGESVVPYYLVDILDAGQEYNVFLFKQDFQRIYERIAGRGKVPMLCGGSGLYIESVLRNYQLTHVPVKKELREDLDKKSLDELEDILRLYGPLHNKTDLGNRKRVIRAIEIAIYLSEHPGITVREKDIHSLVLGIRYDRVLRRERITKRLEMRLQTGLVEEVERLLDQGVTPEKMDYYGLEYRFITRYILKELNFDEMFGKLNTAIHQFAKRQMTYFRGMETRGVSIHWMDGRLSMEEKIESALALYNETGKE